MPYGAEWLAYCGCGAAAAYCLWCLADCISGLPSCFGIGCVAALPTESDGDRSPLLASGVVADEDDCDGLVSTF